MLPFFEKQVTLNTAYQWQVKSDDKSLPDRKKPLV
jgi:hypothetical protein